MDCQKNSFHARSQRQFRWLTPRLVTTYQLMQQTCPGVYKNIIPAKKRWCVLLLLSSVVPQRWAQRLFCVTKLFLHRFDFTWCTLVALVINCQVIIYLHQRLSTWSWPCGELLIEWAQLKQISLFSPIFFRFYNFLRSHHCLITVSMA